MAVDEAEILDILRRNGFTSGAGGQTTALGSNTTTTQQPFGVSSGATAGGSYGAPDPNLPNSMEQYLRSIPGYQFAFNEGQRAVQTSAASRGTLLTGGTLKALTRYGTGIADQTYGNQVDRFLSLANLGQRTAVAPF